MPQKTETPAVDYRAEAETRGRLAFEQATATAEPEPPIPEPLSWLWKSRKEFTR